MNLFPLFHFLHMCGPKYLLWSHQATLSWSFFQDTINVTLLPFLQYSPITEFCNQLALGVFQILKALILTRPIKIHTLKLWCKVYEIDLFFYVFVYAQISFLFHIHKTYLSLCESQCRSYMKISYLSIWLDSNLVCMDSPCSIN